MTRPTTRSSTRTGRGGPQAPINGAPCPTTGETRHSRSNDAEQTQAINGHDRHPTNRNDATRVRPLSLLCRRSHQLTPACCALSYPYQSEIPPPENDIFPPHSGGALGVVRVSFFCLVIVRRSRCRFFNRLPSLPRYLNHRVRVRKVFPSTR